MTPASRKELITLTECRIKISHLEGSINDLRTELRTSIKEKKSEKERLSDRRLTIYLTLSSILGAAILKIAEWITSLL